VDPGKDFRAEVTPFVFMLVPKKMIWTQVRAMEEQVKVFASPDAMLERHDRTPTLET